jgi:hypothetical protein
MAHFFGTVQGGRGTATRTGTARSGMVTHAASWAGAVRVTLRESPGGGTIARAELVPWHGHGVRRVLYEGPVDAAEEEAEAADGVEFVDQDPFNRLLTGTT